MEGPIRGEKSFPEGRSGHVVAAWGDHMFIWGGYTDVDHESHRFDPSVVWKYNIYNMTWSKVITHGTLPTPRLASTASVINGLVIVFGGCTIRGDCNDIFILNLSSAKWESPPTTGLKPSKRNKHASCPYNNRVIFFGGYGPEPDPEVHIRNGKFDVDYSSLFNDRGWNNHLFAFDLSGYEWTPLKSTGGLPLSRAAHSLTAVRDTTYLFGGRHKLERLNDLYSLCLETLQWTRLHAIEVDSTPIGRSWHSCTAFSKSELFLFGGLNTANSILCDSWVFDIEKNSWRRASDKGEYRLWHTACRGSFRGEVLVFGGCVNDIFYDSIHSGTVLQFVLEPKSLQRICMEVLARRRDPWSRTLLPLSLSRHINKLISEGG